MIKISTKNPHFSKYAEINDDFADNTTKMTCNEMCSYYVAMLCHNSSNWWQRLVPQNCILCTLMKESALGSTISIVYLFPLIISTLSNYAYLFANWLENDWINTRHWHKIIKEHMQTEFKFYYFRLLYDSAN